MKYSVSIVREGEAFIVSSRDLPYLNSVGYSLDEALSEALDGIETAFEIYMDDRQAIPLPSKGKKDEYEVHLPVRVAAKVRLYNEMISQNVTKAELARRLGWLQKQADRLLSLKHSTKLESIESAFHALGKDLDIVVA
ncbi:antitoxin [Acinetobacter baumannii]|uniref:antitoxin n=2 Tax=Acinetobacter baumannii TaxID=470 RepID=UPI0007A4BD58|nr:antitoxin [Acinetobacter baumannii]EHU2312639.1 type II toxin-antitoxin system HicB family antitoxin [Acinetobacter baumannii]EHU2655520.1 type II toxin-antitoxin system HicB family antitoxin [Acinetobacter baumannii]EHU3266056.1 type II toxin-antitoxin system HicB family antitoxin [Acinetobacter baumannii]EKT8316676.1 type II toxin-antitoxin system HicB family antitoxin [Acinetobacter baumannii]EKU4658164.1 type II toxin-antitoxin system HicB family antitoxin [Acinetobacter baumannii]